jgi:hypothetical protein
MQVFPAVGFVELLLVLLMGGSLPVGMPPGPMDAALPRAAADGCVVYVDWAARAEGKPGAQGIDGLAADPEVVHFAAQVVQTFRTEFEQNTPNPQERELANGILDLSLTVLSRPGCLFVSFNTDGLPAREDFPNFAPVFERLKVGLILSTGDQSDAVQETLTKLFAAGQIELPSALERFSLPVPVPGGGITLHRAGERYILCYGQGTLDTILAGLAGEREGLLGDRRITTALEGVAVERPSQRSWLDLHSILAAADRVAGGQAMIAEAIAPLGLDAVDHLASTVGVDPQTGRIVSRTHGAVDGELRGLLTLFTGRPMRVEDFAHIPGDADFLISLSLNHARILDAFRDVLRAANAERAAEFDAGLAAADEALGLSIRDDLLAGFGDVWTLYDSPGNGGVLFSAPVLCLEVRDHDKASRSFLRLIDKMDNSMNHLQNLGERRSKGLFVASHEFDFGGVSHAIAFWNIVGEDDEPFAPAFCLTKTHLLVGVHPQTIKGHLRFLHSPGDAAKLSFPADHPLRTRKLISFDRIDTAAVMRYVVAVLPYVGQIAASTLQGERIDIDAFAIPSARGLLPYLSESTNWIEVNEHGVTLEGRNGIVIPGLGGGAALLPLSLFSVRAVHIP